MIHTVVSVMLVSSFSGVTSEIRKHKEELYVDYTLYQQSLAAHDAV